MEFVLTKLGIYGVSAFYVISGISFGYVYRTLEIRRDSLRAFFIRRACRLLPLYWVAVVGTIGLGGAWSWPLVAENVTLAFGLIAPTHYIPTGGWSIGNEMAFYVTFPLVAASLRYSRLLFRLVLFFSAALAIWFAFIRIIPAISLEDQWSAYINPANQWVFFVAGVGLSSQIGRFVIPPLQTAGSLSLAITLFLCLPTGIDNVAMVSGWLRVLYASSCILICAVAAYGTFVLPDSLELTLAFLGRTSYGIYLIHPLVYAVVRAISVKHLPDVTLWFQLALAFGLTLLAAHLSYILLERPAINFGRRITGSPTRFAVDRDSSINQIATIPA